MLNKQKQIKILGEIESLLDAGYGPTRISSPDGRIISGYFYEEKLKKIMQFLLEETKDNVALDNSFSLTRFFKVTLETFVPQNPMEKLIATLKDYMGNESLAKLARFCIAFYVLRKYHAISYDDIFSDSVSQAISNNENMLSIEIKYDVILNKSLFGILKIGLENIPEFIHSFKIRRADYSCLTFLNHMFSCLPKSIIELSIDETYDQDNFKLLLQRLPPPIKRLHLSKLTASSNISLINIRDGEKSYGDDLLACCSELPRTVNFLILDLTKAVHLFKSALTAGYFSSNIRNLAITIDHYGYREEEIYRLLIELFNILPNTINHLQLFIEAKIELKDENTFIVTMEKIPSYVYQFELVINENSSQGIAVNKINGAIAERINENLKTRIPSLKDLALEFICKQKEVVVNKVEEVNEINFTTYEDRFFTTRVPDVIADQIKEKLDIEPSKNHMLIR